MWRCETRFMFVFWPSSRRDNLYPGTSAHTLIDCHLSLTVTGRNTHKHAETHTCTNPLSDTISPPKASLVDRWPIKPSFSGERGWNIATVLSLSHWIHTSISPVVTLTKTWPSFSPLRPATGLYHYCFFHGTGISLPPCRQTLQEYVSFSKNSYISIFNSWKMFIGSSL